MATPPESNLSRHGGLIAALVFFVILAAGTVSAAETDVPEVPVISVTPESRSSNSVLADWGDPPRPAPLSGKERQALLQQVSGGGTGGQPVLNDIQTQGRTPTLRQAILTVKRPWYVHRAFLAAEGVERMDARSVIRFRAGGEGRVVVGLNLIEGSTYLMDFLIRGEGEGDYSVETSAGVELYPDPDGERTHVLMALKAEASGWAGVSLRREGAAFELHSVEVTLATAP